MRATVRVYCFMMGRVVEVDADTRNCPECGGYGRTHRVYEGTDCGNFVPCMTNPDVSIYESGPMSSHGHPCTLAIGHDGACASAGHGD